LETKIVGKHIAITDSIRERIEEKVESLPKFYNNVLSVEVIIEGGKDGQQCSVEVIARGKHNHTFISKELGQDLYACVDDAVKKVERQLVKQKEKERDNKHGQQ
jgi:putative sigma-54 modulation protein